MRYFLGALAFIIGAAGEASPDPFSGSVHQGGGGRAAEWYTAQYVSEHYAFLGLRGRITLNVSTQVIDFSLRKAQERHAFEVDCAKAGLSFQVATFASLSPQAILVGGTNPRDDHGELAVLLFDPFDGHHSFYALPTRGAKPKAIGCLAPFPDQLRVAVLDHVSSSLYILDLDRGRLDQVSNARDSKRMQSMKYVRVLPRGVTPPPTGAPGFGNAEPWMWIWVTEFAEGHMDGASLLRPSVTFVDRDGDGQFESIP